MRALPAFIALFLLSALPLACGRQAEAPRGTAGDRPESAAASDTSGVVSGGAMEQDTLDGVGGDTHGRHAGGKADPPSHGRSAVDEQVTGKVVVTGGEASTFTTLQVEGRRPVRLVGDLEEELRRLSGAVVRVEGTTGERSPGAGLTVRSYHVLSIDGERPNVGTLLDRDGALWLAAADTVRLAYAPEDLRAQAGAKVWIIGRRTSGGLQVQSYGVIRDK